MLTDRFAHALTYANTLHATQVRKGANTPYIGHLLSVAGLVLEHGGTEDEAIAALLHDAVEDQGGDKTRQEIARRFGSGVADIVSGCTDSDTEPKPPWKERKTAYLAHLRHASPSILRVSNADKLHNARAILSDLQTYGDAVWERFTAGKAGTLWYYRALADAFSECAPSPLARDLNDVVTRLEQIAGSSA